MVGSIPERLTLPAGFVEEDLGGTWDLAVGLTFTNAGRMFVWERTGKIWEVVDGVRRSTPLIDISEEVGSWGDHGLLGVAFHPDFASNGYVYLWYAVDRHHLMNFGTPNYSPNVSDLFKSTIGRLTRYRARSTDGQTSVDPASRTILIGDTLGSGCPILHDTHGVGSVMFATDGTMLLTCGDGSDPYNVDDGGHALGDATGIISQQEDVGAFRAQMIDSLSGKVLRIDPATGDGIPSNPYYDPAKPRSARSRVWALGLRNPYRATLRPGTGGHDPNSADPGTLYLGDVGWVDREEIDVVQHAAQNFGWPIYEGLTPTPYLGGYLPVLTGNRFAPNPLFGTTPAGNPPCTQQYFTFQNLLLQDTTGTYAFNNPCDGTKPIPASVPTFLHTRPVLDWHHLAQPVRVPTFNAAGVATETVLGAAGAPTGEAFSGTASVGGVWYTGDDFPAQYKNTYFHSDFTGGWIKNLVFDDQNRLQQVRSFAPVGQTPIVAMATHPTEGGLYYISYGDSVRRIRWVGEGNQPPIAKITADKSFGTSPLTVQFTGSNSRDPELGPLTYRWDFGDGTPVSTQADPVHVFNSGSTAPRTYIVRLTVTDSTAITGQTAFTVVVNNTPPTVAISTPVDGGVLTTQPVNMSLAATVSDAEQAQAALVCAWTPILHHNEHIHIGPVAYGCSQSTFLNEIPCDDERYWYELKLEVSDGAGLTGTKSAFVYADCSSLPLGPQTSVSTNTPPDYTWRRVLGADQYEIIVDDASGAGRVHLTITPEDAGCANGEFVCTATSTTTLVPGEARFRVRPHNPVNGWRAWSEWMDFTVTACSIEPLDVSAVTASSEYSAEYPAGATIDGSLATRWSSLFADPQWLLFDLGASRHINRAVLHWENAASRNYDIQIGNTPSGPWTTIGTDTDGGEGEATFDELDADGRYFRVYSRSRTTSYGVSLWEVELFGDTSSGCEGGGPTTECGNGVVEAGEECDDDNSVNDDACTNACHNATCSDGARNHGETGVDCGGPCAACTPVCGNGTVQAGEQCDDGNTVNDDNCTNACRTATCTDGAKNHGETGVDCGGPCAACAPVCGNGVVQSGEQCDDGNTVNDDNCTNACRTATCSDGFKNHGETGVDCGGPCVACTNGCDSVLLTATSAVASSNYDSTYSAPKVIDKSLTTRWSSVFSDPQWIYVDLGDVRWLDRVVLRWEAAYSTNFDIQVANASAGPWVTLATDAQGNGGVDEFTNLGVTARYLRVYSRARNTGYGVSLWEVEVYGDSDSGCGLGPLLCGDGNLDAGEACDDANHVDDDTCSNDCEIATCSDGWRNHGETGTDCGGPCAACVACGDGIPAGAEQCDDGNTVDNDACSNLCVRATCSDGRRNQGETGVDCGGPCGACIVCGDGTKAGSEQCDDGNTVDNDACSNACISATCSDTRQNQGETAVDCGGPCAVCNAHCGSVRLTPASASASSVYASEHAAAYAIDNSTTTRWSSVFSDPQWIQVDLGAVRFVDRMVLRWENAASRNYQIQTASSATGPWTAVYSQPNGDGGVDDITTVDAFTRYVRVYGSSRTTGYGHSLWEVEFYGDTSSTCTP